MKRRYCSRCKATQDHRVVEQGQFARWLECSACKLRTRYYDLRARTWAGV